MPRRPRLFVPGAAYHVCCCVARGELVFDDRLEAKSSVNAVCEVVELTVLTVCHHGLKSSDVARVLRRDRTTISRWLSTGLRLQHEDTAFRERLDRLDRTLSSLTDNAAMPRVAP